MIIKLNCKLQERYKRLILAVIILPVFSLMSNAQEPALHIEGKIIISNDTSDPEPGSIRFNQDTKDFEGWNGITWLSLTRNSVGTVEDIDGNVYQTIIVGNQEWMMENLRVSNYNDGAVLFNFQDSSSWVDLYVNGAWCNYNNNPSFDATYGKLYNGKAMRSGKLCPTGWNMPSSFEWNNLINYLGGSLMAGGKLKTIGTLTQGTGLWETPNTNATNKSGFSGVPAGYRNGTAQFQNLGIETRWRANSCTQTGGNENCSSFSVIHSSGESIATSLMDNWGGSVRCLKNN